MKPSIPPDPKTVPAADGPLTRLIDDQKAPPNPAAPALPQPVPAKHGGQDDYAKGTTEHDDDREV